MVEPPVAERGLQDLQASVAVARGSVLFLGSTAQARYLWHPGLAVPWHVGSSRQRD